MEWSKTDDGVDSAALSSHICIQNALPCTASLFTAELMVLKFAVDIINQKCQPYSVIYSDSRSAIAALTHSSPANHPVQQIQCILQKVLRQRMKLGLCWIPAHVGIQGNERADAAANEACSVSVLSHLVTAKDCPSAVKPLIVQDWQLAWNNIPLIVQWLSGLIMDFW